MSELDSIPVVVEGEAEGAVRTQNLKPLLLQIEQGLQDLKGGGATTSIDLGAMPFSSRDEEDLRRQLGEGEVSATLKAFGLTLIQETGLPAVWLIEHQDTEGRRLTLHLEVTRIPEILVTPEGDIADALVVLKEANTTPEDGEDEPS
jgi:hydrogenase-1 operon protein HyaF